MTHGLNAVAVGVKQERCVVARVVIGPEARRPIAASTCGQPSSVEGINGRTVRSAEAPVAVVGHNRWIAALPDTQIAVPVVSGSIAGAIAEHGAMLEFG